MILLTSLFSCLERTRIMPIHELLPAAWHGFKHHFLDQSGRVVRPLNNDDTVSEGQAYALWMAVALNDRETFDRVLTWTERHLSRKDTFSDHLSAWHWETHRGVTDWNSATDAEIDMALALILAHFRWGEAGYRTKATQVLSDVLALETDVVQGQRYLVPGNWRHAGPVTVINPSYLSPAHFRIFHLVTGDPRWLELIDSSYAILQKLSQGFDGQRGVGVVPDWIGLDQEGVLTPVKNFSSDATWDAVRMPWRVALDRLWFQENQGHAYLMQFTTFFAKEWARRNGTMGVEYTYKGQPINKDPQVSAWAMAAPAFQAVHPTWVPRMTERISRTFHESEGYFQDPKDYYQNSLTVLGLLSLQTPPYDTLIQLLSHR